MLTHLRTLINARYSLLYIYTSEEKRALETLYRAAASEGMKLLTWSIVSGLRDYADGSPVSNGQADYMSVLQQMRDLNESAIIALLDYHPFLQEPYVVRSLREIAIEFADTSDICPKTAVIVSPQLVIPKELEKEINLVDYPLPNKEDLLKVLDKIIAESTKKDVTPAKSKKRAPRIPVELDEAGRDMVAGALLGLTEIEAENVLAKGIVTTGRISADLVPIIIAEKEQIVKKMGGGAVEYIPPNTTTDQVGGLDLYKQWGAERADAWSEHAAQFKLAPPRGVVLVGEPGTGKSLAVKALANLWKAVLIRVDVGGLRTGIQGGSEENLRRVLKLADAIGFCLLWFDEVEKGWSGMGSSDITEGGTTAKMMATMLTWMEEHTTPVCPIATANLTTLDVLPPEFIQRFTDIFWVDKPNDVERRQIVEIHLKDRGLVPGEFDLDALVAATAGMVGRQIKNTIHAGMYKPFRDGRPVTTADILGSLEEQRQGVKDFGGVKARPASSASVPLPARSPQRGRSLKLMGQDDDGNNGQREPAGVLQRG